jgi:hypothetical protein
MSPTPSPSATPDPSVSGPATQATATASAAPSGWVAAGYLPDSRDELHLVVIGDGRVLGVGTHSWSTDEDQGADPTADLWDPATASWRPTAPLNKLRTAFAIAGLADGRALVVGGTNDEGQSFSSAYAFDPATETWTKTGVMGVARSSPTLAALPDGRAIVMGGYFRVRPRYGSVPVATARLAAYLADVEPENEGAALATAEVLGTDGQWTPTGPMRYARFGAQAATLADGRVLVFGSGDTVQGVTVAANAAYTSEIYDPAAGRFSHLATLPDIDRKALNRLNGSGGVGVPEERPMFVSPGTLVALDDGGALLVGWRGSWKHVGEITRSFRYDAGANTWTEIGPTYAGIWEPYPRTPLLTEGVVDTAGSAVAATTWGRVVVAGGSGPNRYPETGYNEVYTSAAASAFDPISGTWTDLPPMPAPRERAAAVTLVDGSVLVVGGSATLPMGIEDEELTPADDPEEGDDDRYVNRLSSIRFIPSP